MLFLSFLGRDIAPSSIQNREMMFFFYLFISLFACTTDDQTGNPVPDEKDDTDTGKAPCSINYEPDPFIAKVHEYEPGEGAG